MSNVEADENDGDADLIFISEDHIDLEQSPQPEADEEVTEEGEEERAADDEAGTSNVADDAEVEDVRHDEEEEQEGGQELEQDEKLDKNVGKEGLMVVDEWDDDEIESEPDDEVKEKAEDALNPESIEHSLLHMPVMKVVLEDLGHLKDNRSLVIHPLDMSEIEHPKLKEIIERVACDEVKVHYVRSKQDSKTWTGIMVLNFLTPGSAAKAMGEVKEIKKDIDVKLETKSQIAVDQFLKDSRSGKHWTDNVLVVRNLTDDVKLESLKELFPDAEEVIIHKEASKRRESTLARGYAFLLYPTDEVAANAAKEYESKKLMLDGHRLYVLQYRLPVEALPRGLLRLRERRVILKQLDKLTKIMEKAAEDPTVKVPETATKRIEKCKAVIEKDDKARKEVNLVAPSYEEMKQMDGLPAVTAADCHRYLVRFGIIEEPPKKEDSHANSHKQDRPRSPGRRGDKNPQRPYRKEPSPRGGRRMSPRKRNWNQPFGRNQRPGNMLRSDRNAGGMGAGAINPLALLQQGLLGTGALLNPGLLMQPNVGAALLGGAGLVGNIQQQNLPVLGGLGSQLPGHGLDESTPKVLRLDESGNFRSADSHRFQERDYQRRGDIHPRGREREDRPFRGGDIRHERQRSRSPPGRSGRMGQHGDMRGYGDMSGSGMGRGSSGGRAGGDGGEISNPVNLLLNLSQMLSQKMEQKRQQVEREKRGYDRDYGHGGPR